MNDERIEAGNTMSCFLNKDWRDWAEAGYDAGYNAGCLDGAKAERKKVIGDIVASMKQNWYLDADGKRVVKLAKIMFVINKLKEGER